MKIDELRKLGEKATPAFVSPPIEIGKKPTNYPWQIHRWGICTRPDRLWPTLLCYLSAEDVALVAAARNHWQALLDVAEAVEKMLEDRKKVTPEHWWFQEEKVWAVERALERLEEIE